MLTERFFTFILTVAYQNKWGRRRREEGKPRWSLPNFMGEFLMGEGDVSWGRNICDTVGDSWVATDEQTKKWQTDRQCIKPPSGQLNNKIYNWRNTSLKLHNMTTKFWSGETEYKCVRKTTSISTGNVYLRFVSIRCSHKTWLYANTQQMTKDVWITVKIV